MRSEVVPDAEELIGVGRAGQLIERTHARRVWARDRWHLCSRLLRKVRCHAMTVRLTAVAGHPPLDAVRLVIS